MPSVKTIDPAPIHTGIPPSTTAGMLGEQSFQAHAAGDARRAAYPHKPVPKQRILSLIQGQPAWAGPNRGSGRSVASTIDSGMPRSESSRTLSTASNPEPPSPFDDTSSLGSRNPFSDTSSMGLNSLGSREAIGALESIKTLEPHESHEPHEPLETPRQSASLSYPEERNPFSEDEDDIALPPGAAITAATTNAAVRAIPAAPATRAAPAIAAMPAMRATPSISALTPAGISPRSVVQAYAEADLDIRRVREELQRVLADAAPRPAGAAGKTKPAGAAALRALARKQQRHSPDDALHHSAQEFYKALLALSPNPGNAAIRQAGLKLAALARRAAVEGHDAVESHLIKRILNQYLHSLPPQTLCQLAHLNEHDNETGQIILLEAGKLLGADKRSDTPAVEQARKEHAVASVLLGLTAEFCRDNGRTKLWNHQVLIALEAARRGQHRDVDGALREMWHSDLLLGEMDRPRVERLKDMIRGLPREQQSTLAAMLGASDQTDAASGRFADFMDKHLADFESHEPMRNELKRFVDDLRTASRPSRPNQRRRVHVSSAAPGSPRLAAADHEAGHAAVSAAYPPAITPAITVGARFAKTGQQVSQLFSRIKKTFGMKQPARDAAREKTELAVRALIKSDSLSSEQITALKSIDDRLHAKLGPASASFQRQIIQTIVRNLKPEEAPPLLVNLEAARGSLQSSTHQDSALKKFYDLLHERLEREAGIRRCAAAMVKVTDALAGTRRPEKLVNALNLLADAQGLALRHQSELDFCEEALARLGEKARLTLRKRLKGRDDIQRHMDGINDVTWNRPAAWPEFHRSQLDVLSRAARAR